jgi:hypothetical protein
MELLNLLRFLFTSPFWQVVSFISQHQPEKQKPLQVFNQRGLIQGIDCASDKNAQSKRVEKPNKRQ